MLPLKLRLLKQFDHVVGRWLCHHLRPTARGLSMPRADAQPSWAPRPVPKEGIERILILRPGGIGDAVLTFPMIRALNEYYDRAAIDVLGERRNAQVYRINNLVRQVFCYDRHPLATLRRIARTRYQLVIDTEQYHHLSSVVANYLRPDYLCGFDTLGRGRFQTHRVRYLEQAYEVYAFLNLAGALIGRPIGFDVDEPFLQVARKWQAWAAGVLAASGDRPVAAIVPSASSPHRFWPPQRYARVAAWLVQRGFFVVVLGGEDAIRAARVVADNRDRGDLMNLAGRTNLGQTAGVIQRARLYLSADTGVLHIAYGVGAPTVHMFGSGVQQKWAPPGRKYLVVHKNLPCSPCTRYGYTPPCPYGAACMDAITVEDVIAAIEEVLQR